jgi:hypothetical protein
MRNARKLLMFALFLTLWIDAVRWFDGATIRYQWSLAGQPTAAPPNQQTFEGGGQAGGGGGAW